MNDRLRSVLQLAFHPKTPVHEAEAALHAARRMIGDGGIDALLAARERVVDPQRNAEKVVTYTQTIPMRYQHNWLEIIIQTARQANLDFELISCGTVDNKVIAAMEIKFKVSGSRTNVDRYGRVIETGFQRMRDDLKKAA